MTPEREAALRKHSLLGHSERTELFAALDALRGEVKLTQEHLHDAIACGADATTELLALRGENARLRGAMERAEALMVKARSVILGDALGGAHFFGQAHGTLLGALDTTPEVAPEAIVPE